MKRLTVIALFAGLIAAVGAVTSTGANPERPAIGSTSQRLVEDAITGYRHPGRQSSKPPMPIPNPNREVVEQRSPKPVPAPVFVVRATAVVIRPYSVGATTRAAAPAAIVQSPPVFAERTMLGAGPLTLTENAENPENAENAASAGDPTVIEQPAQKLRIRRRYVRTEPVRSARREAAARRDRQSSWMKEIWGQP